MSPVNRDGFGWVLSANHNETVLDRALMPNHNEAVLDEALSPNHNEAVLLRGYPVGMNHSETVLAG